MAPSFRLFRPSKSANSTESRMRVLWLIVGLGNPGRKYDGNRHNAGFHVVDRLADAHGLHFNKRRNRARLALGTIDGIRVVLVKPQTYMNLSGEAVAGVARFYKVSPDRILVVFDDLDLPLGSLRLRWKGGAGGHKGVASIIARLNSRDFPRLRIGIGRPPGRMSPEAYVLQDFKDEKKLIMEETYQRAIEVIQVALRDGIEMAMNQFN